MNNSIKALRHLLFCKGIATRLAFLLVLVFLAACGGGSNGATSQDSTGEQSDNSLQNKFSTPTELAAVINAPPAPVAVSEPVALDASPSTGTIHEYLWDFGDGNVGSGMECSHAYAEPGTYQVILTVVAENGTEAETFQEIIVNPPPNQAPVAGLSATPASGQAPLFVSFIPSGSGDVDGEIIRYDWDYGDGKGGFGTVANHTYAEPGNYTTTLIVTDDDGATAAASVEIVVTAPPPNQAPTAAFTASPASGEAPLQVTFNGSASSDPDGSIASHHWTFGDGQTGAGAITSHSYSTPGSYEARLTVTDDAGDTAAVSRLITVLEPVAGPDCSTNPCDEHATCDDSGAEISCSCFEGWTGDGFSCSMVAECEDNTSREGTTPCSGGYYLQLCQDGRWSDTPACSSDDADGDLVSGADDPDDGDNTICGDSDGDGCDDCSVSGVFSPARDGWDENGDGACELPLDFDCMNGANAATDPYRLQACIQFTYVNQDRERFAAESGNAAPLKWNEDIWEVAVNHSLDMCEKAYFSHTNPAGQNPSDRAWAAGLPYGLAENIAINLDPGAAQYAFMEEPTCVGHRANILEPRAIEAGIGYHVCGNPDNTQWYGYQFVTQNFRWDFRISASAYCQDDSLACQVPPDPPTTAPCPADLTAWGFCPVPSEETLLGWGCQ